MQSLRYLSGSERISPSGETASLYPPTQAELKGGHAERRMCVYVKVKDT